MSKFSRPERVLEIVRRRLGGEPVSLIAEDMGVSRTYIYSVLSQMPKEKKPPGKEKKKANFSGSQDLEIVMDYLALNPSQRRMTEFGKTGTDELVIQRIALMHDLPEEQISEILYRVAARHPMVAHFPLYSRIDQWKTDNLISMRELADITHTPVQKMNHILKGLAHMPLETAMRVQDVSGLSLYEIYYDLIELDNERQIYEQTKS